MAVVVFGLLVLLALGALRYEVGCLAYRLDKQRDRKASCRERV